MSAAPSVTPAALRMEAVTASYAARTVLHDVALSVRSGEIAGIIGPNGAGKSTLLRVAGGVLAYGGRVELLGRDLPSWPDTERARAVAAVPQLPSLPVPLTVLEIVTMGRIPHAGAWRALGDADRTAIARALTDVGLQELGDRLIDEVSAGERQRAFLAMALAQEPSVLLLDEPTSHLDVQHAWQLMEIVDGLARSKNLAVVLSTHDLNLAAAFCSQVAVMKDGRMAATGAPVDVLTAELLGKIYGHPLDVLVHNGRPRIWPVRR